ncbi:hypothetical protein [Lentzea sp. NBRC 102530]|uniref:hypothetical protein n=1 Tax=Lentzea sp. NBRC 102530 TaxID=3032201 RepID=UPI0024A166B7|nr:hypothetical protein [Lentzea sp. NBRC 102530]GLY54892.1 hypothetical protein Lesp01_85470 [Lentzea sp. NBRC 102530]
MATRKVTFSFDTEAHDFAVRAANRAGMSLSAWMSRAARREAVRTGVGPAPEGTELDAAFAGDELELAAVEEELRAAG